MKFILYKNIFLGAILLSFFVAPPVIAAKYNFRWVVQNAASHDISGVVGTTNVTGDTLLLTQSLVGSFPRKPMEAYDIQFRKLHQLAYNNETPDIPLSHFEASDYDTNYWAAHLFYDHQEYYVPTFKCNIEQEDIDAMNEPPGGGHITIQIKEGLRSGTLDTMNIIKPVSGTCSVTVYPIKVVSDSDRG